MHQLEEKNSNLGTELENSGIKGESKLVKNLKKKVLVPVQSKSLDRRCNQISDLEKEKREREQEPNIVKDLIRAAQPSAEENQVVQDLQLKVKSLEQEIDEMHSDTEKRIRVLRQETENARTAYEKRLAFLQTTNKELSNKLLLKQGGKEASLSKKEVDKQMSDVRTFYQKKIKDLEKQLEDANRAIQRQNAPGRLLNQEQRKQIEANEEKVLRTSQTIQDPNTKAKLQEASSTAPEKDMQHKDDNRVSETLPLNDPQEKFGDTRQQEEHNAGGRSTERAVKVAWGASSTAAEHNKDTQAASGQAEADLKDRRIQQLEDQLKNLQSFPRELAGGMYPEYMQALFSDPSMNSMRYQMMMMQQKLKESERAREVAELTLHAVEQSTKSVSGACERFLVLRERQVVEQAQGEAQRRIEDLLKQLSCTRQAPSAPQGSDHPTHSDSVRHRTSGSSPADC